MSDRIARPTDVELAILRRERKSLMEIRLCEGEKVASLQLWGGLWCFVVVS